MRWEGGLRKGNGEKWAEGKNWKGCLWNKKCSAAEETGAVGEGLSSRRRKMRSLSLPPLPWGWGHLSFPHE